MSFNQKASETFSMNLLQRIYSLLLLRSVVIEHVNKMLWKYGTNYDFGNSRKFPGIPNSCFRIRNIKSPRSSHTMYIGVPHSECFTANVRFSRGWRHEFWDAFLFSARFFFLALPEWAHGSTLKMDAMHCSKHPLTFAGLQGFTSHKTELFRNSSQWKQWSTHYLALPSSEG
jgi:hypothetical protein